MPTVHIEAKKEEIAKTVLMQVIQKEQNILQKII